MRLIITRPEVDCLKLAAVLQAGGHEVIAAPLIEIVARTGVELAGGPFQAVALSSANAARVLMQRDPAIDNGGEASGLPLSAVMRRGRPEASPPSPNRLLIQLDLLHLPAFTPGAQSAAAARAAGFAHVTACGGDIAAVARTMIASLDPKGGPVLYLSGAEIAGDLTGLLTEAGFTVQRSILYDTRLATALPEPVLSAIRAGAADGVLLYSPRTAGVWRDLAGKATLAQLTHYCLSAKVAAALDPGWPCVIAAEPTEAALIASLRPA